MAFPEQNPHQCTIQIFQSVPFPPTILPQQVDAGANKNEAVCPNLSIVCFKKQPMTLPLAASLVIDANSLVVVVRKLCSGG